MMDHVKRQVECVDNIAFFTQELWNQESSKILFQVMINL